MNTRILPADDPRAITRAVEVLHGGGVIALPTAKVYGVGALVANMLERIALRRWRARWKDSPRLRG